MSVYAHWRLRHRLRKLALAHRSDFVLPDGVDGYVHLEHVLLRPEGLCVVDILEGSGRLIAGERLADWTLVGKHRFVFPNPLEALDRKITAVHLAAGRVPVAGLVVLAGGLQLARAQPPSVVSLAGLAERLPALPGDAAVAPEYAQAWERLVVAPNRAVSAS